MPNSVFLIYDPDSETYLSGKSSSSTFCYAPYRCNKIKTIADIKNIHESSLPKAYISLKQAKSQFRDLCNFILQNDTSIDWYQVSIDPCCNGNERHYDFYSLFNNYGLSMNRPLESVSPKIVASKLQIIEIRKDNGNITRHVYKARITNTKISYTKADQDFKSQPKSFICIGNIHGDKSDQKRDFTEVTGLCDGKQYVVSMQVVKASKTFSHVLPSHPHFFYQVTEVNSSFRDTSAVNLMFNQDRVEMATQMVLNLNTFKQIVKDGKIDPDFYNNTMVRKS